MTEPSEDEVRRLAAAIGERAKDVAAGTYHGVWESWREFTSECLESAGIELADEGELELAAKWMWRSAFMGGNYTLDARRVLKAVRGGAVEP